MHKIMCELVLEILCINNFNDGNACAVSKRFYKQFSDKWIDFLIKKRKRDLVPKKLCLSYKKYILEGETVDYQNLHVNNIESAKVVYSLITPTELDNSKLLKYYLEDKDNIDFFVNYGYHLSDFNLCSRIDYKIINKVSTFLRLFEEALTEKMERGAVHFMDKVKLKQIHLGMSYWSPLLTKMLIKRGLKPALLDANNCASYGYLDTLKVLYDEGYKCTSNGLVLAAKYNNPEVLKFLLEKGLKLTNPNNATLSYNMEVFKLFGVKVTKMAKGYNYTMGRAFPEIKNSGGSNFALGDRGDLFVMGDLELKGCVTQLSGLASGEESTAIGYDSLPDITSGDDGVFIGSNNTTQNINIGIGRGSLPALTTGSDSICIGSGANSNKRRRTANDL